MNYIVKEAENKIFIKVRSFFNSEITDREINETIIFTIYEGLDLKQKDIITNKQIEAITKTVVESFDFVKNHNEDDGYEQFKLDCFISYEDFYYVDLNPYTNKEFKTVLVSELKNCDKICNDDFILVKNLETAEEIISLLFSVLRNIYIEAVDIPKKLFGLKIPDEIRLKIYENKDVIFPYEKIVPLCSKSYNLKLKKYQN